MGLFEKKEKAPERLVTKCTQNFGLSEIHVVVDTETGVNYFLSWGANGEMHMIPVLKPDGSFVVDKISETSDDISVELN